MNYCYLKNALVLLLFFTLNLNAQISFVEDPTVPFDDIERGNVVFADIDGDGDQDVLISGLTTFGVKTTKLYTNDGSGNYTEVIGTPFPGLERCDAAFADIDGDGDLDLIITGLVSNYTTGLTKLYTNDGSGNFTEVLGTPFDNVHESTVAFADVDGDNDLDILLTGLISNILYITKLYTNDGTGNFTEVLGTPFIGVGNADFKFADVDGDNDLDVLIAGTGGTSNPIVTRLYTNDGSGNFSMVAGTPFVDVYEGSLDFADVDGDNDLDVLITGADGSASSASVHFYTNDGTGTFTEVVGTPFTPVFGSSIAFADVDGDNDQDVLITGGPNATADLFINDGNGNFIKSNCSLFEGVLNSSIAFADIDGDNDMDVLITGGATKLYINESQPGGGNGAFITTWETTVVNQLITIPANTAGGYNYNYDIDWGDGNTTTGATAAASHTYASIGTYQVSITGLFPRIESTSTNIDNRRAIKSIDQWGCNPWETMQSAFSGCEFLVINATDVPNLTNTTNARNMFSYAASLGLGTGNWDWDVSSITDMGVMFAYTGNFNKDISSWDTSNVILMDNMFHFSSFNNNINTWNVSNVNNMFAMFAQNWVFNQPLDNWDTSSVANMGNMFSEARLFNQNISNWNTSNVTNMGTMFGLADTFNQDIGNWDTSNVTDINSMFYQAYSFDQDLGNWNVENVANAGGMFTNVPMSVANYDSLLIGWNAQNLKPNVNFGGNLLRYCAGEAARANMIANDGWTIGDAGFAGSTIIALPDQTVSGSFTFPVITGTNLSGNEAYYTGPNGTGTQYLAGDIINFTDFPSYPITLYIYDSPSPGCESEEDFLLTIDDLACAFITTWQTTTANESITIPTTGIGYNYDIDWGDGNNTSGATGDATHTYSVAGDYQVSITGTFPRIFFGGSPAANRQKIRSIDQWGCNLWTSMESAFSPCPNIVVNASDTPNLSNVTSMRQMFRNSTSIGNGSGNWDWITGNVENMSGLFDGTPNFNKNITSWDTSSVTNMQEMFQNAVLFNQDIGSWDVSSVTAMFATFAGATAFNQPLGNWNTGNVIGMSSMFSGATSFNQPISNWNTANVTDMSLMFSGATSFNQPIGNWNTSNVIAMYSMFNSASTFNQPLDSWNTSNVTNANGMFMNAIAFNQPLGNWDTGNIFRMNAMFEGATVFNQDISNWDTSSVVFLGTMFRNAIAFDQNLGNWDVSNVTTAASMFDGVTLSTANYDSLLIGWNAQILNANVDFSGGFSQYCAGEAARASMMASDNWIITDGGFAGGTLDDLPDQTAIGSYTLPVITGTNLLGNQAYYTGPDGTGTMYNEGDVINYADFPSYPITLYIYQSYSATCNSEQDFLLTITCNTTIYYADIDGDGFGDASNTIEDCALPTGYVTNNTDCDDNRSDVYPGATEICDGLDNDCDGLVDDDDPDVTGQTTWYLDSDADGFGDFSNSVVSCNQPSGYVADNTDCDDTNAAINPNATEVCNGIDDDCDGLVDDADPDITGQTTWYLDSDSDGFGDPNNFVLSCNQPNGYVPDSTDCDDTNANVFPGATEVCDGVDNNCDGQIDESGGTVWYVDVDGDGYGDVNDTGVISCAQPPGTVDNNGDCDDSNSVVNPDATEVCDGLDNDCDGQIDEGVTTTFYADTDGDGFGDPNNSIEACSVPAGYVSDNTDCDDTNSAVNPGSTEICDGLDNDCDGLVDDDDPDVTGQTTWYLDSDADGFGDFSNSVVSCNQPSGYVADNTDCDDTNAAINPNATEVCNGIDDDCDGLVDDADPDITGQTTWYLDNDSDGFGDPTNFVLSCNQPDGHVPDSTDCDDTNAAVYPGATEICDGLDNNCDGIIDEGVTIVYYTDGDGDGFGDANDPGVEACSPPDNTVDNNEDCDDTNAAVYPGAPEICDSLDNNCDGNIDEGVTIIYYTDADDDGFGDANDPGVEACSPPDGTVDNNDDCDDNNAGVYPNAPELCDGIDNNCDGIIDEGVTTVYYTDADGDGFGDANDAGVEACSPPDGTVDNNDDCDDTNATIYPNAPELCDGLDNNCDGFILEPELFGFDNQFVDDSFTFPPINGSNLSGNQAYYTEPNGQGFSYLPGDLIAYNDFASYPITLYIYDSYNNGCEDEAQFTLTIFNPLSCTFLSNPSNGATNVFTDTVLTWMPIEEATGYFLSIGTNPDNFDIVNNFDVGNVFSYELTENLPFSTTIYVLIVPYNNEQVARNCFIHSFTTYNGEIPPPFFTPNNDGYNDYWIVPDRYNKINNIQIFDRYGKLLVKISNIQSGWDGTYNNSLMPTNDYWYLISYKDGSSLSGHFSLKR